MLNYDWDKALELGEPTERQREVIAAYAREGSDRAAASALGVHHSSVRKARMAVQSRAARAGYAPGHFEAGTAPGYRMGKVTVQRGPGGVERVWERQHPEFEAFRDTMREVRDELIADVKPYTAPPLPYIDLEHDIVPWFQIGDAHLGMVSYMRETGQNFDLNIGARELRAAFDMLKEVSPAANRCVINDLGDATHYENFKAETERGGYKLDADTRFPKMIRVYTRVWREIIESALEKFQTVDVIINQGNHSRTNDIWANEYSLLLAELIEARYGGTGRVNVISNESVFIGYLMGDTFVMVHHSDKCSGQKLADVMFRDFHEEVKQARHLYIDVGHLHHEYIKKERGIVTVQCWNNLAPNDKHHHDAGWRSKQAMSLALRSRKYGQTLTHTLPVEMVWERLKRAGVGATSEPVKRRAFVAA